MFGLGKQCLSQKLNHLDKTDNYNGENAVLDTFLLDSQICLDYKDFSVAVSCQSLMFCVATGHTNQFIFNTTYKEI